MYVRIQFPCKRTRVHKPIHKHSHVRINAYTRARSRSSGEGGEKDQERTRERRERREKERETRVTFQCQLYNAFYYAEPLLWGNTAMKKEEDVETRGGGRKGQKKKEIALPGFHIESLRSPGTFTPLPPCRHVPTSNPRLPTPRTHPSQLQTPPYPPLLIPPHPSSPFLVSAAHDVFSDIKLFIVHNGVLRLSPGNIKKNSNKK